MIYAFAFTRKNISCQTLYNLQNIDNRYLLWGEDSINKYCEKLLREQPEYILGLGIYTGKDRDHLWMETECSSKFRNKKENIEYLKIEPFLFESEFIRRSSHIGSSYCNLVSYRISKLIKENKLRAQYTFLHIPRNIESELVVREINNSLRSIIYPH